MYNYRRESKTEQMLPVYMCVIKILRNISIFCDLESLYVPSFSETEIK